jgi:hypothetical protein
MTTAEISPVEKKKGIFGTIHKGCGGFYIGLCPGLVCLALAGTTTISSLGAPLFQDVVKGFKIHCLIP